MYQDVHAVGMRKTALRLDMERNQRDLANERWADDDAQIFGESVIRENRKKKEEAD